MFRKRESGSARRPAADPAVPLDTGTVDALDAVASILRALARFSATRPEAAVELDAWASHVLVLSPPPRERQWRQDRDWKGLQVYVTSHIREESSRTQSTIGDLRDTLWGVIDGMTRAVLADGAEDAQAAECLERLRQATELPPQELKQTALEAVAQLGGLIEAKTSRHRMLARELGERVDLLRTELDNARREAELDGLTELGNRARLNRELVQALQLHVLTGKAHALVMVDVDGFKSVNDRFGHLAGDEALRSIADALALSFPRRSDLVCRYGGDEFAVILYDTALAEAERLATRCLEAIRQLRMEGLADLALTVSVGVAASAPGDTPDDWLERADRALYAAKAHGRDRVALATDTPEPLPTGAGYEAA